MYDYTGGFHMIALRRTLLAAAFAGAVVGLLLWANKASATPPASNGDDLQVGPGATLFLDPDGADR